MNLIFLTFLYSIILKDVFFMYTLVYMFVFFSWVSFHPGFLA